MNARTTFLHDVKKSGGSSYCSVQESYAVFGEAGWQWLQFVETVRKKSIIFLESSTVLRELVWW